MEIKAQKGEIDKIKCDLLVLDCFAGTKSFSGALGVMDKTLGGLVSKIAKEDSFEGKTGQILCFRTLGKLPTKWVLVLGLGDKKDFKDNKATEIIRRAAGLIIKKAKEIGARKIVTTLFGENSDVVSGEIAKSLTEGALLANYKFLRFRKDEQIKEKKKAIQVLSIIENDGKKLKAVTKGIDEGALSAEAAIYARELVDTPSMQMTPQTLEDKARNIAKESDGKIKIKVYDKNKLLRMNAWGIVGVGMGSCHEPRMVHLTWSPRGAKKRIALVGKALTFDSGGLSLKPSDGMTTMKIDMAGGAAVLGVFSVLKKLNPKIEIHGIFAAAENMPSGSALRPGDILETLSGKTIEVLNTDAEGRVTLADTLAYAAKQRPDFIVDLATLTGACMVALGEEIAGLMSNNENLREKVKVAALAAGEPIWELPLKEEYKDLIKSRVADVKNIGGKYGGAITAGLFLKEFVGDVPWAHLDIAGPAFAEKETYSYIPLGGTGFGVRLLLELIREL